MQPKSFFAKANMSMLHHFSKSFAGSKSKKRYFSRQPPLPSVSLTVPLPPYLSSCLSLYTPSRTLRSSSDEKNNSFLCKMETQGLWSPVVLCSGAPCLEQSSSSHPTQLLPLTVQNFPQNLPRHFCLLRATLIP